MPRTVTVTFADGGTHVYQGVPDTITPDAIEQRASQEFGKQVSGLDGGKQAAPAAPKPGPGIAQGATQAFGRGASFGFSDRLGALASSLVGGAQDSGGYGDFGGTYSENLKSIQGDADKFSSEHPAINLAANVAGGLASGVPLAKGAAAIPAVASRFNALRPWQQFASSGAAAGGLAGAGNAKEGEMVSGALEGAGTGALLGATIPPALKLAGKAINATAGNAARGVVNALRTPEQQGVRLLAKQLARDEVTPDILEKTLKELGPNATVADAAGRNTLALADYAAQVPGQAKNAGLSMLETRAKTAGGRVMESLSKSMGIDSTNMFGLTKGLHKQMQEVAKTHNYDKILNEGAADMTGNLGQILEAPSVKGALGKAYKIVGNDIALGRADKKLLDYFDIDEKGKIASITKVPTLRVLDYVKRALDSVINDGTDAITGKMTSKAEQTLALKRELLKSIDNINPEYAAVRAAYAEPKAGETALKLGRAFLRDDSEVTVARVADMTTAEKKYFMAGAARAIRDKIMGSPDTGMAYAQFTNRPATVEKLQAAFGDSPEFGQFMKSLENEVKMGKTHARLVGNSQTAARAAVQKDIGDSAFGADAIPTSKGQLIKAGLDYLTKPSDEVSSQLFDSVLSQDPARQRQVLQALRGLDANMIQSILSPQLKRQAGLYGNALLLAAPSQSR